MTSWISANKLALQRFGSRALLAFNSTSSFFATSTKGRCILEEPPYFSNTPDHPNPISDRTATLQRAYIYTHVVYPVSKILTQLASTSASSSRSRTASVLYLRESVSTARHANSNSSEMKAYRCRLADAPLSAAFDPYAVRVFSSQPSSLG
ncbi:hypothetical protein DENSPDRAFT_283011 [Dentipellis sp. KUC8613]|nr:hypothetical protein DENSPDRAFT_283011 [Dentipellis sp. KUC8613]